MKKADEAKMRTSTVEVPVIEPHGIYYADDLPRLLRFGRDTAAREIAAGRLRVAERCGRYYFTGQMLLDWIEGGVVNGNGHQG